MSANDKHIAIQLTTRESDSSAKVAASELTLEERTSGNTQDYVLRTVAITPLAKFKELQKQLQKECDEGREDSEYAEQLRDESDPLWNQLTASEQREVTGR